jgi:hypothetical protein
MAVLLLTMLATGWLAGPAAALCAAPGLYAGETSSARAGDRVVVNGGRGTECHDAYFGAPGGDPDPTVIHVRLYLSRPAASVPLASFRQVGYGERVTVRIPAGTAPGAWTMRTDSGLHAAFTVLAPEALPRTASPATVPLTALGGWLVVAGAYGVVVARRA